MRTDARTPGELVTSGEIARLLGVNPSAVSNWRKRAVDFPAPWIEINAAAPYAHALFVRAEVEVWAADRDTARAESKARRIARLERELERARR